ncbi:Signal transduction histidine kinase [Gracilibacillus ureilyticus]|uniref:histidine kinase n=1 Tax=Gracilibacillus ureilyticus TaxID=531814 RepID=A0A1H9QFJ8_9BACI|nr:ATP-binding protein [Gracilibacillus ureilyticus]SER58639.1 Signal transduction histidine kinase [Gracilibacillus ureilyticus]
MLRKYALLFILITLMSLVFVFQDKQHINELVAENGSVEIPAFESASIYQLTGEWGFYPDQWTEPADISLQEPVYVSTPNSWKNLSEAKQKGIGTYRLEYQISERDIGKRHSFFFQYIGSAYKAYVNGELVAEVGELGKSSKTEKPYLRDELIYYEPDQVNNELIIHVSNFSFREGGIFQEVYYGESNNTIAFLIKQQLEPLLLIGGFLILGIYYFLKYMINHSNDTFLYISLISFMAMVRTFLLTEYVFYTLFPAIPWNVMTKIEYMSILLGMILLIQFMYKLYKQDINNKIYTIAISVMAAFLIFVLVTPTFIYTNLLWVQTAFIYLFLLYFVIITGIKAIINKREGSYINILGIVIMAVAAVIEITVERDISIFPMILTYSVLLFLVLQGVIISKRYDKISERNQELAQSLKELNNSLEHKVIKRTLELERKNGELIQLQKSRSDMMENIAHDLGSPMNAFEKQLLLIKQGYIQPSEALLDTLIQKTRSIKRLANDLFQLSQLQTRKWSIHKETVRINAFVQEIEKLFGYELNQLGLKLESICPVNEKYLIQIDKERIIQVIRNFIDNALKHGEEENMIRISVTINNEDKLRIEVKDFGRGIDKEELPYIFDRFYRKSNKPNSGSGLGLAIAKEIIEQHKGQIGVESERGRGSCFYFTLPIE